METLLDKDVQDTFLSKIKTTLFIIFFSIPVMFSSVGRCLHWMINGYYAGHMRNVAELAAMGLADSWISFVGTGPLISCNYGFFALAAQVNGTGVEKDLRIVCQRGLVFNLIVFALSTIILMLSPFILPLLGVEAHIIELSMPYIHVSLLSLFSEIFVGMLEHLLNAQKLFIIYPLGAFLTTIIHYFQCGVLVEMDLGLVALALSKLLSNIYFLIFLLGYMKYYKINGFLIETFELKAFTRLLEYAKNVIPSGLITYVEWMAFEITTIMASNFDDTILSAHALFFQIIAMNYAFFLGVGIYYSSLLSNALGRKDAKTAARLKNCFNTMIITLIVIYELYIQLSYEKFVDLMTDMSEVKGALKNVTILASTLVIFDFYQGTVASVLRAIALQNYAAWLYVMSYYLIGIPLALIFGVFLKMTLTGWYGAMHLSQAVFCWFGHRKFLALDIDRVILDIEDVIEGQISQKSTPSSISFP